MANHNAVFAHRHASYEEEGAFQGNSFLRTAEGPVEHSKYIDPNLQTAPSLSAPYHQCNIAPQPVQRYLNDRAKTAFFNADYTPKMQPNRAHRRPAMMPPVHAPCHARFPSPTSSHEPSTTGSARSPPADTESYYDNNFPATPPDTTLLTSPYIHPAVHPFDYLTQQSLLNFTNMGPSQANNAYVNPLDVHATQHLDAVYEPEASIDFGLGSHSGFASYEDYDSIAPFDLDHGEQEQNVVVDAAVKRQSSPEGSQNVVEQAEMRANYPYPEMSAQVGDHEDDSEYDESSTAPTTRRRKADDADDNSDTDYKPAGKRNRPGTTSSFHAKPAVHRRRTVTSHQAPPPHPSGSPPSKKKLKTVAPSGGAPGPSGKSAASLPGAGPLQCPHCKQSHFKDQASLDNHVKKQHTRPYHCVFHFAGCTSTFATKNEWKRHVLSQHLLLHYWLCDEGACSKLTNTHATSSSSTSGSKSRSRSARNAASTVAATAGPSFGPPLPNGAIFNRKDLYTQHLRRMHTPPNIKKQAKQQQQQQPASKAINANTTPDWEVHLRNLASRAKKDRCALPTYMRCPAQGCEFEFRGPDAWDQRMEHVGRHLERAASGEDPHVEFGGAHDQTLIDWASNPAVAVIRRNANHQWELNNPLRPTAKATSTGEMILNMPGTSTGRRMAEEEEQEDEIIVRDVITMEHDSYGDVDADGEVDDLS